MVVEGVIRDAGDVPRGVREDGKGKGRDGGWKDGRASLFVAAISENMGDTDDDRQRRAEPPGPRWP